MRTLKGLSREQDTFVFVRTFQCGDSLAEVARHAREQAQGAAYFGDEDGVAWWTPIADYANALSPRTRYADAITAKATHV